jgi:hypothetical protein
MKIRSFTELQDFLDKESSWRKQELSFLRLEMKSQKDKKVDFVIRSSVTLSYAHLEGFTKKTSEGFWSYLSFLKLKRKDVSPALLNSYLMCRSVKNGELNNSQVFSDFLNDAFNFDSYEDLSWDSKKLVKTRSNLKYEVFKEILFHIGLNTSKYDLKEKKIDSLVSIRNSVAHGEKPSIDLDEATEFVGIVQDIIEGFKTDILNYISTENFKK